MLRNPARTQSPETLSASNRTIHKMIELYRFIFKNKLNSSHSVSLIKKIFGTIGGYFKVLLFYLIIVTILTSIGVNNSKKPFLNQPKVPEIYKLLMVVLIMPIVEEIVFRLSLIPQKRKLYISLGFGNIFCFFFFKRHFENEVTHKIFFLFISSLSLYLLYKFYDKIIIFINQNTRLFIHLLTIIFCLIHIPNYKFENGNGIGPYLTLFLMLLNGYYFSLVRLKYGFYYAVFIHVFHNLLVSIPMLIKYF